jgi:hypothetical protein
VLRFGRWCQFACFGVFGRKEIFRCFEDLESCMEDILVSFFHTLYLWTMAFLSPLLISFADFLVPCIFFLFLVMCFLLYTFSVLRGALHFQ